MKTLSPASSRLSAMAPRMMASVAALLAISWLATPVSAQTVIYQEGFNTDGEAANPQRFTTTGRFHSEYPHDPALVPNNTADQVGPVFWGFRSEVSIVGVFGPTSERRALLAWDGAIMAEEITPQFWTLFDGTISWL